MQSLKSVFGVIGALVPILYCGGLLYYFLDLSGSVHEAQTLGLGPTCWAWPWSVCFSAFRLS